MADIALRGYQDEIRGKVSAAFKAGFKRVMLYAPTGAGKTEIAMAMLKAAADNDKRSAMVMDRIVLCEQTSERLQKYSIAHGVMQAGHWRYRPHEKIQVCSQQTLLRRGIPGSKLMILDEAHVLWDSMAKFIAEHPDVYVVGLSASPFADGLGEVYETVVSAVTTHELVEMGNLVPLRVFICKQIDMKGAKKVASEWSADEAGSRAMKITGDIVSKWVEMTMQVFGRPVKTIVFCTNVAHGADLAAKFAAAGYNFVPISYKDSDDFKRDAVKDFKRADTSINGLIACDILTKGFDVPDVLCGISARPFSRSFMSHVQQMGRVMRPHEDKGFALWLDHSGNYLRFQDDWDQLYAEGVTELKDGKEKTKKELTEEEQKQRKCPQCGALWTGKGDTCAACGFVRPFVNKVETVDGVMEELGAAHEKGVPVQVKQAWYSQLLAIQESRGYSSGWTAHKYKEKFGVWPRGLSDVPQPPSSEVLKWEKSRRIAWARGKAVAR